MLQGKTSTVESLLDTNNKVSTSSIDKANTLNHHFDSVFTKYDAPPDTHSLVINEQMADIVIKREGITKKLRSIKSNKSPGPKEIPVRVLKELAPQIAPYLEAIFIKSLSEGKVPHDWKIANVTPIFKEGNRQDPGNYRPISLTSLSCKILEHIIVSNIMTHLESRNFLHTSQRGFRKYRSCETQLALFLQDILNPVNRKIKSTRYFLISRKHSTKSLTRNLPENYSPAG
jgi:hypothetical protein